MIFFSYIGTVNKTLVKKGNLLIVYNFLGDLITEPSNIIFFY